MRFMKDVTITPKNGIGNINEINERMKLLIGKEIKINANQYTIPKEVFIEKQIYDEIRYSLKVDSNGKIKELKYIGESIKDEILLKSYNSYKKILIIVESPHRDEFTFNYEPIGPAQGETGYGIESKIDEIIDKFRITSGNYIVIISNPVQYQSSLGSFYSSGLCAKIRDNLWSKLYKKVDYLNRLNNLGGEYIINATTKGRRIRIDKVLKEYKKNHEKKNDENKIIPIIKTSNHPSNWKKNGIKWIDKES